MLPSHPSIQSGPNSSVKSESPLPTDSFGPGDEAEKPKEAFWSGAPGTSTYRASIKLPRGFTLDVPAGTNLSSDFADYSAHYSLKDGTLFCERKMTIKRSKVAVEQWGRISEIHQRR